MRVSQPGRGLLFVVLIASTACNSTTEESPDSVAAVSTPEVTIAIAADVATSDLPTPDPTASATISDTVATNAIAEPVTVGSWRSIPGGEGCGCSDGSPFELWERQGDPTKVVLYFEGGGACFNAETCAPQSTTYTKSLTLGVKPGSAGVFDSMNPENPLADHSFVYVPYCTGDAHLGDRVNEYSDTLTIDHRGFANASTGLQTVIANYPEVEQLVVAGSSAGSIPTPLFAGLAADALPDAEIITFGDSSGAYPDDPTMNVSIGAQWGALKHVPDWPVADGLQPSQWSLPGLYVLSGLQHPDITFARFDNAYDLVQAGFVDLLGVDPGDLLTMIEATETEIEAAGVPIASYVSPGADHTILARPEFYAIEVAGVRLVDFMSALIEGEVPDDVHCLICD